MMLVTINEDNDLKYMDGLEDLKKKKKKKTQEEEEQYNTDKVNLDSFQLFTE